MQGKDGRMQHFVSTFHAISFFFFYYIYHLLYPLYAMAKSLTFIISYFNLRVQMPVLGGNFGPGCGSEKE